jgi:mono/diheme cytochrome c family protein
MRLRLGSRPARELLVWMAALLLLASCAASARAEPSGKQDFQQNCASCHGKDGKGGGEALYVIPGIKPPDLTRLSKNHAGVFPAAQVYQSIDGRSGIPAHSRIDMPFWGTTLQEQGKEFTPESEAKVKTRISNMVAYIKSIQER